MKENKRLLPVWILFFIYLIIYFVICLGIENQQFLWLELASFSIIISIFLLIQNKMPKKNSIIVSLIFSLVYLVSDIYQFNIFSVFHGILVFLSCSASVNGILIRKKHLLSLDKLPCFSKQISVFTFLHVKQ